MRLTNFSACACAKPIQISLIPHVVQRSEQRRTTLPQLTPLSFSSSPFVSPQTGKTFIKMNLKSTAAKCNCESERKREKARKFPANILHNKRGRRQAWKGDKGIGGSCSIASVYSGIWIWILLLYIYRNIRHGITVHSAAITLHTRIFNQNSARLFFASLLLLLSASASLYNFCACISACCSSIYSPASPPPLSHSYPICG